MRIKGVKLHLSPVILGVFLFFVVVFIACAIATGERVYVIWGLPFSCLLIVLPLISAYNLGSQYLKLRPEYEEAAVPHKIRNVNNALMGHAVRVEGVVQTIRLKWLGRPRYTIYDGSASILTFRSLPPDEPIAVGDNVEVIGMVVKKFAIAGAMSIHAVIIRKVENFTDFEDEEPELPEQKSMKIKKYN